MIYTNEAIKKRKEKSTKIKSTISIITYIILTPLLIYNISLIGQALMKPNETPSFLGIKTYIIISGSMKPELDIGDIVIVKKVKEEELSVGDIISFREGQTIVTHRINEIIDSNARREYITKGDNNNVVDSGTINKDVIEGKVIKKLPCIGKIGLILQGKILIIVIILIVYIYFSHSINERNKKNDRRRKRLEYEKEKLSN